MSTEDTPSPARAIGYVRVSTAEQVAGFGLDVQEAAITRWCGENGLELAYIARDAAVSGSNGLDTRDGLAGALRDAEAGEADVLVVYRLDRLARDLVLAETLIQRLGAAGVRVVSITEPEGEGDEATRTLIRHVLGAIAQYERAVIRARMEAGRQAAIAAGRRGGGRSPYGYRAEGGHLHPVPEEQAVLARMRELYREEGGIASRVARRLNEEGRTPRRGQWYPADVNRVLNRERERP